MLILKGMIRARYRGEYQTKDGELKPKISYDVIDCNGDSLRVFDYSCKEEPYTISQDVEIPVYVSTYVRDGNPRYTLVMDNRQNLGMASF